MSLRDKRSRRRKWMVVGGLFAVMWTGCAEKEVEPVVLAPETKLTDIAGGKLETAQNGYKLIDRSPSAGRFPGAVAVVRLQMMKESEAEGSGAVSFNPLKDQEAAYWNHLFDNIDWVREYFELAAMDVETPATTAKDLVAAAKRLDASLCLLYSQNDFEDQRSQLVGALYDAKTGKLLATIHTESVGFEDWLVEQPPGRPEMDDRHMDNHYLAARKFERLVHACVRELVSLDQPKKEAKPKGWEMPPGPPPAPNSPASLGQSRAPI